jgi:hypothetical protein
MLLALVSGLSTLILLAADSAHATPIPPASTQAFWVDSGWTWTHMDGSGKVLFTRSGSSGEQPRGSTGGSQPTPAACCSASGCDAVDETLTWKSVFGFTLAVFHHRVYWCWSYPRITSLSVSCYATDVDQFVEFLGCSGGGNWYTWSGDPRGGHYSFRQGTFKNCVPVLGCVAWAYPWIKIWVNGNGAWTSQKGW